MQMSPVRFVGEEDTRDLPGIRRGRRMSVVTVARIKKGAGDGARACDDDILFPSREV